MAENIDIASGEAQILSRYLIGKACSSEIEERYTIAVKKHQAEFDNEEQKAWNRMLASRLYLKLIDSGLAVTNPQSALRKRIFIMLALLETCPENIEFFLPQERSIFYLIPLGFRAGLSALYMIFGAITVKMLRIT